MKRLLTLLLTCPLFLVSQTLTQCSTTTSTGDQTDIPNISSNPAIAWRLVVWATGSITAYTPQLDCAPDNGTGHAGTYAACGGAFDGTTNPASSVTSGTFGATITVKVATPHIAFNPSSITGTGTVHWCLTGLFGANTAPSTVTTSGGGGTPTTIQPVCTGAIPTEATLSGTGYNTVVAVSGTKKVSICNVAYASASGGTPNVNTLTIGFGTTDCSSPTEFLSLPGITGYVDQWFGTAQSAASGTLCVKESVANGDKITFTVLQN